MKLLNRLKRTLLEQQQNVFHNNNNSTFMFNLLLKIGVDIHYKFNNMNVIHGMRNIKNIKKCIERGMDINAKSQFGKTPLFFLSIDKDIETMAFLLKNGANPNIPDDDKRTPLHFAVYHSNLSMIRLLLNHDADPNVVDLFGETPLNFTMISRDNSEKRLLIEHGAVHSKIKFYQNDRELFSKEQQNAFDAYASLTSIDSDFFQMCLAYQNGVKHNISMDIKELNFAL